MHFGSSPVHVPATTARPETGERGMGKHLVLWNVWVDGVGRSIALLQA